MRERELAKESYKNNPNNNRTEKERKKIINYYNNIDFCSRSSKKKVRVN